MSMILAIAAVVLLLSLLHLFFVHPLITLWDCVRSPDLSFLAKAFWSLLTLVTGFVGSIAYGLFGTYSWSYRRHTVKCLFMSLASVCVMVGVLYQNPELRQMIIETAMAHTTVLQEGEAQDPLSTLASLQSKLTEELKSINGADISEALGSGNAATEALSDGQLIPGDLETPTPGQTSTEQSPGQQSASKQSTVDSVMNKIGQLGEIITNVKQSAGLGSGDKASESKVYPGDAPLRQNPFATGR